MKTLKQLKTIFAGTPDFAVPVLKLLAINCQILAVMSQPDKKIGRKQKIAYSPIKELAIKNKIPILQPKTLKNQKILNKLKSLNPDIIIVAAYGKIIPEEILKIPKYGCVNIHASLLPKYRGASPIQSAILNGEKQTGITIIKMNKKMDQGNIIAQIKEKIYNNDTAQSLHNRLANLGSKLLIKTLPNYVKELKSTPQNHSQATYTKIIHKQDGKINWNQSAQIINQQIRAFFPWPSTFTFINKKRFKIIKAKTINKKTNHYISEIFKINNNLAIACKDSYLIIQQLQPEGKKILTTSQYLLGNPDLINQHISK